MLIKAKTYLNPKALFYISTATAIIGLFTTQHARALPNFGFAGMAVASFFYLKNWKVLFSQQSLPFHAIFSLFFLYAISGFFTHTGNELHFLKILQLKTALLVIPFAFCLFPGISKRAFIGFLWVFLATACSTAILSLITYVANFHDLNALYLESKAMPVAGNHVRYSLMVVTAILAGSYILYTKSWITGKSQLEQKLVLSATIFLVLFLHLLSVRSGLLAFYGTSSSFLLYSFFASSLKKYRLPILALLIAMPMLLVIVPTSRNKIKNTLHDLTHVSNPYSANYESITARIFSYKVAFELFQNNTLLGVGVGNLKEQTDVMYIKNYAFIKAENRLIPHNQFLFNLVAFGIVGTCVFTLFFFYPLFYKQNFKKDLFLPAQYIILVSSFMFEATLETHLGLIFSCFFLMLPLSYLKTISSVD